MATSKAAPSPPPPFLAAWGGITQHRGGHIFSFFKNKSPFSPLSRPRTPPPAAPIAAPELGQRDLVSGGRRGRAAPRPEQTGEPAPLQVAQGESAAGVTGKAGGGRPRSESGGRRGGGVEDGRLLPPPAGKGMSGVESTLRGAERFPPPGSLPASEQKLFKRRKKRSPCPGRDFFPPPPGEPRGAPSLRKATTRRLLQRSAGRPAKRPPAFKPRRRAHPSAAARAGPAPDERASEGKGRDGPRRRLEAPDRSWRRAAARPRGARAEASSPAPHSPGRGVSARPLGVTRRPPCPAAPRGTAPKMNEKLAKGGRAGGGGGESHRAGPSPAFCQSWKGREGGTTKPSPPRHRARASSRGRGRVKAQLIQALARAGGVPALAPPRHVSADPPRHVDSGASSGGGRQDPAPPPRSRGSPAHASPAGRRKTLTWRGSPSSPSGQTPGSKGERARSVRALEKSFRARRRRRDNGSLPGPEPQRSIGGPARLCASRDRCCCRRLRSLLLLPLLRFPPPAAKSSAAPLPSGTPRPPPRKAPGRWASLLAGGEGAAPGKPSEGEPPCAQPARPRPPAARPGVAKGAGAGEGEKAPSLRAAARMLRAP